MSTAEEKLREILHFDLATATAKEYGLFQAWFLQQFETSMKKNCNLEDFALYFLSAIRQQTEIYLKFQESETPLCQTPVHTPRNVRSAKQRDGTDIDIADLKIASQNDDSLPVNATPQPQLFSHSLGSHTSTPVRRPPNHSQQRRSGSCLGSTEKPNSRNSSASSSFCLGDFLKLSNSNQNRSNRKKTPQQQHTSTEGVTSKPMKRVVPTTISLRSTTAGNSSTPFKGCSSFSNENNILKITGTEVDDKSSCSIAKARKSLKLNPGDITKELQTAGTAPAERQAFRETHTLPNNEKSTEERLQVSTKIDLDKVTDRISLQRLAYIYGVLLDLNYTPYVLNEISFLFNLLNANDSKGNSESATVEKIDSPLVENEANSSSIYSKTQSENSCDIKILNSATNCISFALYVLDQQRQTLALLDAKSLSAILEIERVSYLHEDLKSYLENIQQRKQQLDLQRNLHNNSSLRFGMTFKNVYYREEDDGRHNFSSNNEFGAFKSQRDLFYKVLKLWEENHLNPTWSFSSNLTPRIREIFTRSENPITMAHFAKLFVSQLLISAVDATSPEEMGLDIDMQKLSRLTQRLIAPSNSSVDYQFPRNQAFFRDFILESRSLPFSEQLKMALYQQLIKLNDSPFEELKLLGAERVEDEYEAGSQYQAYNEVIVCPEILTSMLVLAKFLGFTSAQPFNQNLNGTSCAANIEKKQLVLRSLFQPQFNICSLLLEAIKRKKLLITLPWLVQYLAMLDNTTLQLDKFVETTQIMFELYMHFTVGHSTLQSTTIFIVRCCVGWFFEVKPFIVEQYYNYRVTQTQSESDLRKKAEIEFLIVNYLDTPTAAATTTAGAASTTPSVSVQDRLELDSMLESVLSVACPFLAEFRVSIMPIKTSATKYVSRTGRYRHITTKVAALNQTVGTGTNMKSNHINDLLKKESQDKLVDAFLHSQSPSMRRLIEFIMERVYKSVVKDAQCKILLPSKSAAESSVSAISSTVFDEVMSSLIDIYTRERDQAICQWDAEAPALLEARIEKALEALLPAETMPIVRKTYGVMIARNAALKVQQWRNVNLVKNYNFYCNNVEEMALKICKLNQKQKPDPTQSSELRITQEFPSVSDLIDELQYLLHCTSLRADLFTSTVPIRDFLERVPLAFENTLPTLFYRLLGGGIVQLMQHLIAKHPVHVTADIMQAVCDIFHTPQMQNEQLNQQTHTANKSKTEETSGPSPEERILCPPTLASPPSIYEGLITVPFIRSLGERRSSFDQLKKFLVTLIERNVITVDFVNTLFVPIFKEDWHTQAFNEMSIMLQTIAQETAAKRSTGNGNESKSLVDDGDIDTEDDAKSNLFMEVLADFSRDVDGF